MNEQFQQIKNKALAEWVEETRSNDGFPKHSLDVKVAELLVRKCAELGDSTLILEYFKLKGEE